MSEQLEKLQTRYNELLQRARPNQHVYRFQTERSDDGAPHVEIDSVGYHFVATERGLELSRLTCQSEDELLYAVISLDTFWMGVDFEFRNRIESSDCRRMIFAKQLELMRAIDPVWAELKALEIDAILRENPYADR